MKDESKLNTTEKQLRDALERLVAKKPNNIGLKQKLKANKLKLVVSNIEKEAGLSNGAAKRYPKIKVLIESAEANRIHGASNVSDIVIRSHPLYLKAKEDLTKAKKEIKKLNSELEKKEEKLKYYKGRLKSLAVQMHQMTAAMWMHIPEEEKHVEIMINAEGKGSESSVLKFKKREKLD